ncbi:beta-ketoacyl synthase [Conexibacter sp. S30A1]|jgi:3-oxoacyl-[acyl-carrier-protein] synthase II|uniref:beta-ketoacyl-[acyl-carrier-protein] synthase family protein n=1 Tax=Conexibacter sp. S30A1 TaxID=2937800 RepID=UPI00200CDF27|nr:beta-ketoacyl-[acyl-carrier-protein] synthase II [Conexibacter sp. S30A1]
MADKRRAVITGIGAVTPLGVGARYLHERWARGISGVSVRDGQAGGYCDAYDPAEHLSVKEARRLDRFAQFAVIAADEAIGDAGWSDGSPYDPMRVGLVMATGIGGFTTVQANLDVMREKGPTRISPLGIPMYMPNAAAAAVSMRHGIQGQSFAVASACASSGHAIGLAARMIQYGDADAVIAGGAEATLTDFGFGSFNTMSALSKIGISCPFDARRDGFIMGEGAGVLVLEEYEQALARGATIIGEVAGYGSTSDAHHLTAPEPTGRPAAQAIKLALDDAGLTPGEVSYVNAHGTSTELNDAAETVALKLALGEHAYRIPVSSTKSATGHLLGAAGAIEAVATVQALNARVVPPTLNYEVPDPELDLDYVPNNARELVVAGEGAPAAISNSFAFGGHNVSLVIRGRG